MPDQLEQNSRTIREARRGQIETLVLVVPIVTGIVTAASSAAWYIQVALLGFAAIVVFATFPRWGRIKRYRRQDHQENINRKPQDV